MSLPCAMSCCMAYSPAEQRPLDLNIRHVLTWLSGCEGPVAWSMSSAVCLSPVQAGYVACCALHVHTEINCQNR